jgi:hypothetical protein
MGTVFSHLVAGNEDWPQSTQNQMALSMNRFLTSLTDISSQRRGETTLYVPNEDLSGDTKMLAKDKELAQVCWAEMVFASPLYCATLGFIHLIHPLFLLPHVQYSAWR